MELAPGGPAPNDVGNVADPVAPGPLLEPGSEHAWPNVSSNGGSLDLSRIPSEDESRFLMAYLTGFEEKRAWYAIKNRRDMSRVEFSWDPADFPYAWLWQEMHAQMGGDTGAGMMSGDSWESMQAMHEAIDPAVMQQMHDEMVEQLPPELRADAEAMHDQMFPAMTGADGVDHASHHPTGS